VGEHEVLAIPELLDHAEHVVPAPGVQPARVVAELVEDLLHLEGGQDRLDQYGRAHAPLPGPERVLRVDEDVVPEPRLAVALEFREIEVGAASGVEQALSAVEEVEPE